MTQIANDTFTEASAGVALGSHTSDSAHSWTISGIGSSGATNYPEINATSDKLEPKASSGEHYAYYSSVTPSSADYSVSLTVGFNGNTTGLDGPCIRMAASSAFTTASYAYVLMLSQHVSQVRLRRYDGGTPTTLATASITPVSGVAYRLTVIASGSTISGKCQRLSDNNWLTSGGAWQAGEVTCVSVTDATYGSAGKAGLSLYSESPFTTLDDFSVDENAAAATSDPPLRAFRPANFINL